MTEIEPRQIQQIQTICSKRYSDREARLEFFESFFGQEIKSTKDLTKRQADNLIYYLNTGNEPEYRSWAFFKKGDTRHGKILGLAKEYDWIDNSTGWADLNKLGKWIASGLCPVKGKSLLEMNNDEISKVIYALQQMVLKKW